ncbi:FAD-dependent oxidoreductase [Streptomyces sp. LHD-70]|uniref:FAD-dependent oxidoreductase n=1 Tax=Streptomyces sp. LHD-70 TaxID=3072140 RepID=UPI00280EC4B3|nr:FAD-dependent oxidoreductase [Streptomyces sp. LHD-70]MDQ8706110.1 FAD-dependent oxidoreductase [Streptomyces sp. LHD-70]
MTLPRPSRAYDVLVIGGGAAGSATAWQLASLGHRVCLLERFEPGHRRGSSHGRSRLLRLAYPDPLYVGMAVEALRMWDQLESETGADLITTVGAVDGGRTDRLDRAAAALTAEGAAFERLTEAEAAGRWPQLRLPGDVLFHPGASRVDPDATLPALQRQAERFGCDIRHSTPVTALEVDADRARAHTPSGTFTAPVAVVTVGPWTSRLLDHVVKLPELTVTQEQVFHLPPRAPSDIWPAFSFQGEDGGIVYGMPTADEGVKVAEHLGGREVTPDGRDGVVDADARRRVLGFAAEHLPGVEPTVSSETTCLYTNTADEDFLLDRIGPLVIGTACSGHGFKFTPLLGRMLADLAVGESGPNPRFRLGTTAV